MQKLQAILLLLIALMTSCTGLEYQVDDEIVEMNWGSAVKDFYVADYGDGVDIKKPAKSNDFAGFSYCDPAGNRTPNRQLRRLMLYPIELPDH